MTDHAQRAENLPYFDEYLTGVLRPRVERILAREQEEWNGLVWKALVKTILAEQKAGSPITADNLERLLRDNLGLRIEARVETSFHGEPGAAQHADHTHDVHDAQQGDAPRGTPDDVIAARRPMSPLVRAIAGQRRG